MQLTSFIMQQDNINMLRRKKSLHVPGFVYFQCRLRGIGLSGQSISPYQEANAAVIAKSLFHVQICFSQDTPTESGVVAAAGSANMILAWGEHDSKRKGALSTISPLPSPTSPPWAFLPSCLASWAIRSVGSSCVAPGQLFPLYASCAAHSSAEMMSYLFLRQSDCATA